MPGFPELTSSRLEMPQAMAAKGEVTGVKSQARRLRGKVATGPCCDPRFTEAGALQVCGCFEPLQCGKRDGSCICA